MGSESPVRAYIGDKVTVRNKPAIVIKTVRWKQTIKGMSTVEADAFIRRQRATYGEDWRDKHCALLIEYQGGKREWCRAEEAIVVESRGTR